jgi:isoquinoline 1-oxidoreductase alpha subunit
MLRLTINGTSQEIDVEPDTPLLWVIRDTIGMTGTKYGCGIAQCGACTVHIDGVATRSCAVLVGDVAMIMAVSALLHERPKPTDADIDSAISNICRCGTFQQVRAAIHAAASA